MLYFLDFDHFEKYGKSVTEDTYVHKEFGPVPENINTVLCKMVEDNLIQLLPEQVIDFPRDRIIPLVKHNPKNLKSSEMEMICEVTEKWAHHTAKELVSASHGEAPWIATRQNEIIPYTLAYYRGKFSQEDVLEDIPITLPNTQGCVA